MNLPKAVIDECQRSLLAAIEKGRDLSTDFLEKVFDEIVDSPTNLDSLISMACLYPVLWERYSAQKRVVLTVRSDAYMIGIFGVPKVNMKYFLHELGLELES